MKSVGDGDRIAPDDRNAKESLSDKRTREQRDTAKKQI